MPVKKRRTRHRKQKKLTKKRLLLILAVFLAVFFYFFILKDLPSPNKLSSDDAYPVSTKILDRNGELLYEIYVDKNRTPIKLEELPQYVKWATIAAEDKNFYKHSGFVFTGIARAAFNTVFRRKLQGGSTISQQLVKNALLTQKRTVKRKVREAFLTIAVEIIYPKDKILEMYLNQIPYGGTAYGIGSASQLYFGKPAKDLTLAQTALLAGLPASPTRYSPFGGSPQIAEKRQEYILKEMVKIKKISEEEAKKAKEEEIIYADHGKGIKAPHFVMYVKDQLVEKYGQQKIDQGGLQVWTTLDLEIQEFAQTAIASEVAKLTKEKVTNGAVLVTNPKTGEILAMAGSKDYFAKDIDGNVNVTTSLRQPGSSIKPLNYALAFEKKFLTPASLILDIPTCFDVAGQKRYCPSNYDNQFHGGVQARFTLGNSYNVPAVKTLALNGLDDFIATASAMGITTFQDPKNYGLSLTLGGGEVKMTDMAVAFAILANKGEKQNLYSIEKIEDYTGKVLEEHKFEEGPKILSPESCYLISHILLDNNARQPMFGASSYLVVKNHPEVSVKTGTTNDRKDNWTIGYTPSYVVAVWVGNNDNKSMSYVASGITGASPIWNKTTRFILEREDKKQGKTFQEWPVKPEDIIGAEVCVTSGLLPGDSGCPTRYEYFIKGTLPIETENLKRQIFINKDNQQAIQPGQEIPLEKIETQEKNALIDLTGSLLCLDCPFPTDPAVFNSYNLKKP
ncbi:penicillin-binding protein [Candidatus Shapirobacteria bacterium CG_4_9_14_0_2_um_filter_40_11]|uniref:Penicillin-binding protein n=1 Tax=Candidatus Shapirobacteria bacterium CG_4_9_14_0_2_um_filter_40_11 TaxID=1974876 RepID=A0A2M8EU25_9BACT|nr:MAG: penicillin-binding protein [Candidatus Shapirobacteria bacterium CG_4_9_14_0_2_um_filter_40_11]